MGVKNWKGLVPWREVRIDEINPPSVAIDVPNYMIRRMAMMARHRSRITERVPLAHLTLTLGIISAALRRNIVPVFVVDGPPESLKRPPQPDLVKRAVELYGRFRESEDPFDVSIAEELHERPPLTTYFAAEHIRDLCSATGVPAIGAPSEAEMTCAVLCKEGYVGTVASNDADAVLFGSPHVSRSLKITRGLIERAKLQELEYLTGLNLEQLRDLAILCGCDFHKGLRRVGPRKGVILLQRYGGLVAALKASGVSASEREQFMEAREVFDEPNSISVTKEEVSLRPPVLPRVVKLLSPAIGREKAEARAAEIVRLWKDFGKEQTTMEQWI